MTKPASFYLQVFYYFWNYLKSKIKRQILFLLLLSTFISNGQNNSDDFSVLIKKYSCNYISQGQLDLQGSFLDGILDYGDNTCDNQATYTHSNGAVYNVNL